MFPSHIPLDWKKQKKISFEIIQIPCCIFSSKIWEINEFGWVGVLGFDKTWNLDRIWTAEMENTCNTFFSVVSKHILFHIGIFNRTWWFRMFGFSMFSLLLHHQRVQRIITWEILQLSNIVVQEFPMSSNETLTPDYWPDLANALRLELWHFSRLGYDDGRVNFANNNPYFDTYSSYGKKAQCF